MEIIFETKHGFARANYNEKNSILSIDEFSVDQLKRSQGFGTELYKKIESHIFDENMNVEHIIIEVNENNLKGILFWKKMGFIIDEYANAEYLCGVKVITENKLENKDDNFENFSFSI